MAVASGGKVVYTAGPPGVLSLEHALMIKSPTRNSEARRIPIRFILGR